jgi:hypothetical protein
MTRSTLFTSLALSFGCAIGCSTPVPPETPVNQGDVDSRSSTTVTAMVPGTNITDRDSTGSQPAPQSLPTDGTSSTDATKERTGKGAGSGFDNPKDKDASTEPAAMEQGNSDVDINRTKQIRRDVMANASLSFLAKNVTIITNGGRVTLRGKVKTLAERTTIEAIAQKVAGQATVDNRIEIQH